MGHAHIQHPADPHICHPATPHPRAGRSSLMPWSFRLQAERRLRHLPSLPAACPTLAAQHVAHMICSPRWRRPACTPAPATPSLPLRPTLPGTLLRPHPMSRRWAPAAQTSRPSCQSLHPAQAQTPVRLGPRTKAGRLHTAEPAQAPPPYPAPDHRLPPGSALAQAPRTRWVEQPARRAPRVAARPALQCLALPAQNPARRAAARLPAGRRSGPRPRLPPQGFPSQATGSQMPARCPRVLQ